MNTQNELNKIINSELILIDTNNLVERYNSALFLLTGKRTSLSKFHIDCTGHSPEIAKEFNDKDYLNPHGVNRQFIIIDIEQASLPPVEFSFSTTPYIIKTFIDNNRSELLALTAIDCVYGYVENNTPKVTKLSDILDITKVKIICDTPKNIIHTNNQISDKVIELTEGSDASLLDFNNLSSLIELCKKTPSINYDRYRPKNDEFAKSSFYTNHFGGFYVFKKIEGKKSDFKVIIYLSKDNFPIKDVPTDFKAIHWEEKEKVLDFLKKNNVLVPINKKLKDQDKSETLSNLQILKERILCDYLLSHKEIDTSQISPLMLNSYLRDADNDLPEEFITINELAKKVENSELLDSESRFAFYTHKINDNLIHGHMYSLMNHLVANYTRYSYVRMFKYNRELFMKTFEESSEKSKEMIISYLNELKS